LVNVLAHQVTTDKDQMSISHQWTAGQTITWTRGCFCTKLSV